MSLVNGTRHPAPGTRHPALSGFAGPDVPSYDILNTCVQCGLCLPTCPTYREVYREQSSPRGRLHLMKSVHDGRLDVLDPVFVSQMHECLNCRACEAVCPSGVRYGPVLEASRAQIQRARDERGVPVPERTLRWLVFRRLFRDMRLFRVAATLARLYQRGGARRLARSSGLLRALGLERLDDQLPDMTRTFFVPRGQLYAAQGERRGLAGLLAGCIMHTAYGHVDRATVRLLTRNGWDVAVPQAQGCCGALHAHAGDLDGGRELMRGNIAAFEQAGVDVVVSNAAGCGAALKEYGHLLRDDPSWSERAAAFSAKARDITELLASFPMAAFPNPQPPPPNPLVITYQEPCHLVHAQGISAAPRALLQAIPGLTLVEMAESSLCCGSAGTYSVTQPEMSGRLLDRKLDHALATGASIIATANPGCALQLEAGLRRRRSPVRVRHVVELLDAAYRRGETNRRYPPIPAD
jgi:glycolate oxidase iron-sulfur subunit